MHPHKVCWILLPRKCRNVIPLVAAVLLVDVREYCCQTSHSHLLSSEIIKMNVLAVYSSLCCSGGYEQSGTVRGANGAFNV